MAVVGLLGGAGGTALLPPVPPGRLPESSLIIGGCSFRLPTAGTGGEGGLREPLCGLVPPAVERPPLKDPL